MKSFVRLAGQSIRSVSAGTSVSTIVPEGTEILIANRGLCAEKLSMDFNAADNHAHVLYTKHDAELPRVLAQKAAGKAHEVSEYKSPDEILRVAASLKAKGAKKVILPLGWGFLSEDADFAEIAEKAGIIVAGAHAEFHRRAGDKMRARETVDKVNPAFNPLYTKVPKCSAESLAKHAASISTVPDHGTLYNSPDIARDVLFGTPEGLLDALADAPNRTLQRILDAAFLKFAGKEVVIKPTNLGGGRGMTFLKVEPTLECYKKFMAGIVEAKRLGEEGDVILEERIRNAWHIELQCSNDKTGGTTIWGARNCSEQRMGQKLTEKNVIQGDLPEGVLKSMTEFSKAYSKEVSNNGEFPGNVFTMEFMVTKAGRIMFLEANTRVQVEHPVTETDVDERAGIRISIPFIQASLAQGRTNAEMLAHYGLDPAVLETPGTQRIVHVRICALDTEKDFTEGKFGYLAATEGLAKEFTLADFKNAEGVNINLGAIAPGKHNRVMYDPQVGAVWGRPEGVKAVCEQIEAVTGLKTDTPWVLEHVFPHIGKPEVTTETVDELRRTQWEARQQAGQIEAVQRIITQSPQQSEATRIHARNFSTLVKPSASNTERVLAEASSLSRSKT